MRLEIRNHVKTYSRSKGGRITPVDRLSLQIKSDEFVVLLGPSGCGKTTVLRCVAGLERPDEGEIVIDGEVVYSSRSGVFVPANSRRISMIFQSFALWPHMHVFAN